MLEQVAAGAEAHSGLAVLQLQGIAREPREDRARIVVRPCLAGAVPDAAGSPQQGSGGVEGPELCILDLEHHDRAVAQPRDLTEALELLLNGIVDGSQGHHGLGRHLPSLALDPLRARVHHHADARAVGDGEVGRWGLFRALGAGRGGQDQKAGEMEPGTASLPPSSPVDR